MKNRTVLLILVVTIFCTSCLLTVYSAVQSPKIIINGEVSGITDEITIIDDKIYIPLTSSGSELGYYVEWDEEKGEATIIKYDKEYPANIFYYVASDLDGIQLFALNRNTDELLSDFILTVDGVNKVFKWEGQNINRQYLWRKATSDRCTQI